jgi:hypothetical protein
MALKGSCLCKTVQYEADALASPIGHCHCHTCRKASASAYTSTARVARSAFRLISGEDRLTAYESTPGKLRRHCSVCGTEVLAEWVDQPHVILRVATLDDNPGASPVVHIWTSHDAPWLIDIGVVPRLPEGVK